MESSPGSKEETITPPVLPYSAGERQAWGPWLFRPSVVSLLLVASVMSAATYLRLHHQPWERTAIIDLGSATRFGSVQLTPEGLLVIRPACADRVTLWDLDTGTLLRTIGPSELVPGNNQPSLDCLGDSRCLLESPHDEPLCDIYDLRDGRSTRRLQLPPDVMFGGASSDARYWVGIGSGQPRYSLWEWLPGDPAPAKRLMDLPAFPVSFSNDGRFMAYNSNDGAHVVQLDGLRPQLDLKGEVVTSFDVGGAVLTYDLKSQCRLWSLESGQCRRTIPATSMRLPTLAPSGSRVMMMGWLPGSGVQVYHVASGKSTSRSFPGPGLACRWGPDDRVILVAPLGTADPILILEPDHLRPIAKLPAGLSYMPDGRFMALNESTNPLAVTGPSGRFRLSNVIHIYKHVGHESALGVLGLPQCWVLGGCVVLLVLSLGRDARRRGASPTGTRVVTISAMVLGGAGLLHLLIGWCIEDRRVTFLPIYLLLGLGLLLGGRFWRWASLVILAAGVPVIGLIVRGLWPALNSGTHLIVIFDREFEAPRLALSAFMGAWLAWTALCMWQISRRRAAPG